MAPSPGEGRGAFVQRVQEALARELRVGVAPGFTVSHKRALASGGGGGGRRARGRA